MICIVFLQDGSCPFAIDAIDPLFQWGLVLNVGALQAAACIEDHSAVFFPERVNSLHCHRRWLLVQDSAPSKATEVTLPRLHFQWHLLAFVSTF